MAGLADELVELWISAAAGLDVVHGAVPNGDRAFRLALVVDHIQQQPIDGHGISSKDDLLRKETELRELRKGPAVPDTTQPVHDLQYGLRTQRLRARERRN